AVYDIARDDAATRQLLATPEAERPRFFDRLRKEYPRRREFFNTHATVLPSNPAVESTLAGLGFVVQSNGGSLSRFPASRRRTSIYPTPNCKRSWHGRLRTRLSMAAKSCF
ncbi:MAG: DUF3410 domain-containing protein, partial [Candidatus Hydrogenedentes bacterium]|nr:DUF3410 domain-containing protein [Candidatus Hydrogenedentota bacterium]